jgi:hypothetical protein
MKGRKIIALGAAAFVLIGCFYACGGSKSSGNPTQPSTPASTTGTLTIKGSSSASGALWGGFMTTNGPPQMLPGTPTSLKVRMQKVYLAANADCTNPVLVQDKGAGDYQDLVGKPTIFSGSVAAGTYNCLALKISDIMKFTADATAAAASNGVCVAGRENDFDILKVEQPAENWYDVETGGTIAGAGTYGAAVEQNVFLFISTNPSAVTAANARVHVHQLVPLVNPVVIKTSQVTNGAFVFDAANRIAVTQEAFCWLEGAIAQFVGQ